MIRIAPKGILGNIWRLALLWGVGSHRSSICHIRPYGICVFITKSHKNEVYSKANCLSRQKNHQFMQKYGQYRTIRASQEELYPQRTWQSLSQRKSKGSSLCLCPQYPRQRLLHSWDSSPYRRQRT